MISVIIPVYNEASSICMILDRLIRQKREITADISKVELIIINDGSIDDTVKVVSKYSAEIKFINLTSRLGYGKALKIGFEAASGELISFLDGDNTYSPEVLSTLHKTQTEQNADIVVGSRFLNKKVNMSKVRYIGNKLFIFLVNWLGHGKITDATSGARLFKRNILPKLYPLPDGLDFTIAMTTKALFKNLKIVEVPINYNKRIGKSKLSIIKDGFRFIMTVLNIAVSERFSGFGQYKNGRRL